VVLAFDDDIHGLAKATKSTLGTGGMGSKLKAAQLACSVGSAVIMANGSRDGILDDIRTGVDVGTLFVPKSTSATAFKTWLGKVRQPKGILTLDAGAVRALLEKGKSLLAVGVTSVSGSFSRGDVLSVCDADGRELGRGLVNYNSGDAAKMAGKSSEQIEKLLGKVPYVELLHRDNFAAG
jgi:glutamate 5-kinase